MKVTYFYTLLCISLFFTHINFASEAISYKDFKPLLIQKLDIARDAVRLSTKLNYQEKIDFLKHIAALKKNAIDQFKIVDNAIKKNDYQLRNTTIEKLISKEAYANRIIKTHTQSKAKNPKIVDMDAISYDPKPSVTNPALPKLEASGQPPVAFRAPSEKSYLIRSS